MPKAVPSGLPSGLAMTTARMTPLFIISYLLSRSNRLRCFPLPPKWGPIRPIEPRVRRATGAPDSGKTAMRFCPPIRGHTPLVVHFHEQFEQIFLETSIHAFSPDCRLPKRAVRKLLSAWE
jgi:hypothetical protein